MISSIIAILIIVVAVGAAIRYMVKAKKRGVKCIGCSASGACCHSKDCKSGCGCYRDKF